MGHKLRIHSIVEESIVDGPGIRYAIFTQGCPHHCQGCHNPETHTLDGGKLIEPQKIITAFQSNPLLTGITFSGGEPFLQPKPLCVIAKAVKDTGKNIFTFTGFTFEQLLHMADQNEDIALLLDYTDVLVDGPYKQELRDLDLDHRGSSNQRVLDYQARRVLAMQLLPAHASFAP